MTRKSPAIIESIEQEENIVRVRQKIGDIIIAFWRERLLINRPDFRANELSEYMNAQIPNTTFDSASRILRDLRQRGLIDYEVVSRKDSLYRLKRFPAKQLNMELSA